MGHSLLVPSEVYAKNGTDSSRAWTSYQIRYIAGYACMRRECRDVFPPPTSKETANYRSRHSSRHVRHARAVM